MFITIITKKVKAPAGRHVMPNTYSQLYIKIVFVFKGRQNLISKNLTLNILLLAEQITKKIFNLKIIYLLSCFASERQNVYNHNKKK